MRISPQERSSIRRATEDVAGDGARALLFGSRVHDDLRGGDIDLLVELPAPAEDALGLAVRIAAHIQRQIGLRKIDVLIADPASPDSPLLRQARQDAVAL
jgi:predicted nucleotidyltransferase